jgi:translation initiation factor 1 (eIF-1/SUI1)
MGVGPNASIRIQNLPRVHLLTTIVKGINGNRGDLKQLAATLNNPLKRWPGAYARAFLLPLS